MEGKANNTAGHTNMEASMAPVKSDQSELLHMHPTPSWKQYESEEEDISETSSQSVFSRTDGEAHDEDDVDESVSDAEYTEAQMPSPSQSPSPDDSSSTYSPRLSIATAKRSSAATYVAIHPTVDDGDVSPCTEYVTPPASPFYLSPVRYAPEAPGSLFREESVFASSNKDEEEMQEFEWDEVFEAKQVVFTAPASKPSIVMIQSPTTEAILSARMGDPISKPDGQSNSVERPINISKRTSTKRSSSASGMSPPDRPKRYSAIFYRDLAHDGEVKYWDSRNHVRARSSQGHGRSRSRSRADSSSKENRNADSSELRPVRPRRNTSQRSTRSNRYAPDYEMARNYSRPHSIRSSSVASDNTTASSVSWKRDHPHNRSNTSLQYSSSSSVEHPPSSSSSSSTSHSEADMLKPVPHPHPLSIITTPTSPTKSFSPDDAQLTPQPHSTISARSEVDWPQIERANTPSTTTKTFSLARSRNPSLPLSLATAAEDIGPHSRMRKDSWSTSSPSSTRKLSISTSGSASASSKAQTHAAHTMKLLMGGFRGLAKQRARQ